MIKTTNLTKTVYKTRPSHSQPIRLYTPPITSSSGSACETDPSSISSSYKSNAGTNDDLDPIPPDESALSMIVLVDKLKRELATTKQAKSQLATLYKVKCKSDLDKSAKITKLRLQFEHELSTFCKQDQKDLVCYLQRQLLVRDQRITELSYDIEQLKNNALNNNDNEKIPKKTEPIQILRCNDPDLVISTNRRLYDEHERALQRQNIELHDRVKKFEKQIEVIKHDQPRDHSKELVKRALSKQANEFNRILAKKDDEIEQLNARIKQLPKSYSLEAALRQSNIEKLHLEKRLLSSTSSSNSATTTTNASPAATSSTSTADEHASFPRTDSSSSSSVNPGQTQATDELLETDAHANAANLKPQRQQLEELQEAYQRLESKYNRLLDAEERGKKDQATYLEENQQLKEKIDALETNLSTKDRDEIERLQAELQQSNKERETMSTTIAQLRADLANTTNTNERLSDDCDKLRAALIAKTDQFDSKQREHEQLKRKSSEMESTVESLREKHELQRRLSDENEVNKKELKRKQDDFEQFQKMHDVTKREQQATIHLLQDKIHDLERKTELQSMKHDEILVQLKSIKDRRDRVLPASAGTMFSMFNNNNNANASAKMMDSQTSIQDDSAPIKARRRSTISNDKSAQVVMAKYSYEPLKFSPNDHPEIELPLKSGDFYLIYGDADEDGFYDGRNLEGRYGLIPSNFIELVTNPYDLPEHTRHLIQKLTGKTIPMDDRGSRQREQTLSLDSDVFTSNTPPTRPTVRKTINSSSSDMSNDDLSYGKHVPCPNNLRIEKSLSNSVLIAWNPPSSTTQILGYQVLLDHSLYATVRANERTRALLENINLNDKSHRISIRTITQRGLSNDQECTLLLTNSKEAAYMPHDLRVDRITQTSAVVSWWPASNDIVHKLFVNDIEVQTLKPGVYRFKLSGLLPSTLHKVTIKAKPLAPSSAQQQVTASMEFQTTSFDESIEPPKRVQVIAGPQTNTILISWEPPASISAARGYRVLIDGRQAQDINNPLNDHTVINLNTLREGRYLTMRTLTENNGESHDSAAIDLDDVLKKLDMDISLTRIATISKEIIVAFRTLKDNETPKLTLSSSVKSHRKTARAFSTIPQEQTTPIVPLPSLRATISGNDMTKSSTRSSLDSPSMSSSMNTIDISASELRRTSPKTPAPVQSPVRQQIVSNANRIRSPVSESVNKSLTPDEQRPSPKTSSKTSPAKPKNPLLDKTSGSPRLFIALFDYDPNAMSPNQDSDEELPFKKGQILKIFGEQDADGFYIGQADNGRTGYVPSNLVSELESDESETDSSLSTVSSIKRTPPGPVPTTPKTSKKMVALFDYNAAENSPNTDHSDELSFRAGDIVYVHGDVHEDGFYSGELDNGKKGFVPSNYLKEATADNTAQKKENEPSEDKKIPAIVNAETIVDAGKPAEPPAAPTEAPKPGFFDRLKSTFTWNSNDPI